MMKKEKKITNKEQDQEKERKKKMEKARITKYSKESIILN